MVINAAPANLGWDDNSNDELGFRIERSPDGSTYSQIATVGANTTSYTDPAPATGVNLYRVRAYNSAGDSNPSNAVSFVNAPAPIAPTFTTQPISKIVSTGATVSLSVVAKGSPAPAFQWFRSGIAIPGATSAALTFTNVSPLSSGTYTVIATNAGGSVTSSAATLTVNPLLPVISNQPSSQSVTLGSNVSFFVIASDSTTYQWRKDGVVISGATSATLTLTNVTTLNSGSYTVTATNAGGSVTTLAATLTVNSAAKLSGTPIGSAPWRGLTAGNKFAAFDGVLGTAFDSEEAFIFVGLDLGVANAIGRFRYYPRSGLAYRMRGARIRGANAADLSDAVTLYTISSSPPEGIWQEVTLPPSATRYRYVFFTTEAGGYGNVAELEFYGAPVVTLPAPSITAQPESQTVNAGARVSFTVAAAATAPTYQWFRNDVALGGATGATLSIDPVSTADAGNYTVVVSSATGDLRSTVAALIVNTPAVADAKLSGIPIGSAPWRGLAVGNKFAAFDGNLGTAFDSEEAFIFVGLDLGVANAISRVRYYPRSGLAYRMNGARIRGANSADLRDAVTLFTITNSPAEGRWQDVSLPVSTTGYRYVFFTTDAGGYGNIAELEFYGSESLATASPTAAASVRAPASASVNRLGFTAFTVAGTVSERDDLKVSFTVAGAEPTVVLVRGLGPALASMGIRDPLMETALELASGTSVIATNRGWNSAANAIDISAASTSVGAISLNPSSGDSAILRTMAPGVYTVSLRGRAGASALLEIHQVTPGSDETRLTDVSIRGFAGSGDKVLTAGFTIPDGASRPLDLQVRSEYLPWVSLFRGSDLIADNRGIDPALSAFLRPSNYSIQLSSRTQEGATCQLDIIESF